MQARIFRPAKTATSSGRFKTRSWLVELEPRSRREADALIGWVGSDDTDQQVTLRFPTKEAAIAFCQKKGLSFSVSGAARADRPAQVVRRKLHQAHLSGVAQAAVVEARDLRKSFGPLEAVAGLSFAVGPGECLGLLGPNGAGKTTIMRMIMGLTRPSAGQLTLFSRPPAERRDSSGADRHGAAGGQSRPGPLGDPEFAGLWPLFRPARRPWPSACRSCSTSCS